MIEGVYVTHESLLSLANETSRSRRSRRATGGYSGTLASRIRGRGVDLDEVRLYQAGDDVRSIDWKVTARKQKAHTKVFREERERPTMIIVDQTDSMFFGSEKRMKSVAAAEIASRLAWRILYARDRVGGVVIGRDSQAILKPIRSQLNVVRFLKFISDANNTLDRLHRTDQAANVPWQSVLLNIRRATPIGHRLVFISDFQSISDPVLNHLLVLRNHNELALIHVYDDLEHTLPNRGSYAVTDGERRVTFDGGNTRNQANYATRFEAHQESLKSKCQSNGVRFESVSTSEDTTNLVIHE